jgi:hypothetical protein
MAHFLARSAGNGDFQMLKCCIRLLRCTAAPLSLRRTSIRYVVEFEDAVIRKPIGELFLRGV